MSATGILQATTVIAKTTQTLIGAAIPTEGALWLTFFGTYAKGDETGLDIVTSFMRTATGTAHPLSVWTPTAGVYTRVASVYRLTASANFTFPVDLRGVDYVMFTQGGSNNDGTPTGTLAAAYTFIQE